MSTFTMIPNLPNQPAKPIGNGSGSNLPGASGLGLLPTTGTSGSAPISSTPFGSGLRVQDPTALTTGAPPTTIVPAGTEGDNLSSTEQGNLGKQASDLYGKGVGGLLTSEIENLGSNDSSYMQAYEKAMAPINAENLATLETNLGNEGVSGNSSTSAIAQADFNANVTSQEGMQEEELQMNDLNQLLGLTESMEGTSSQAQQVTPLSIFGKVAGDIGSDVGGALGGTDLSGIL